MHTLHDAPGAGSAVPENGDALITGCTVQGVWDQSKVDSLHSDAAARPPQETPVLDGEACAREYLDRVRRRIAEPGELGSLISYLVDDAVAGALRTIEKVLEARHG